MTDINKDLLKKGQGVPSQNNRKDVERYLRSLDTNRNSYTLTANEFKNITGTSFDNVKDILGPQFNVEYDNIRYDLGKEQGVGSQALGFLNQAIVGELIGGTIEGAGYLLDLESWGNIIRGEEGDFTNGLSELGKDIREFSQESTPIFQDLSKNGLSSMLDTGWWLQNGVSLASTLSLMLPVGGVVKGLSYVGRAANLTSKLGKTTRFMGKTLAHATMSRHAENMMEASQIFDTEYQKALNLGLNEEQAREAASVGAASAYRLNSALILQDIFQSAMLLKSGVKGTKQTTNKLAEELGISKMEAAAKRFGKYGIQHGSEALEEGYQYVVGKESELLGDERMALLGKDVLSEKQLAQLKSKEPFSKRMKEYLKDGELYTSMFFGALGSGVTQGVFNLMARKNMSAEELARVNQIKERGSKIATLAKEYNKVKEEGSEQQAKDVKVSMAIHMALDSSEVGNYDFQRDFVSKFGNMSSEERENLGIQDLDDSDVNELLTIMDDVSKDYAKNRFRYEEGTAKDITMQKALMKYNSKMSKEKANQYNEALNNIPNVEKLSTVGSEALNEKAELAALKTLLSINKVTKVNLKNETDSDVIKKQKEERLNNDISSLEKEIADKEESYKKYARENSLNREDREVVNNEAFFDELVSAKLGELVYESRYNKAKDTYGRITSKEYQSGFNKLQEKIQEAVANQEAAEIKEAAEASAKIKEEQDIKANKNASNAAKDKRDESIAEEKAAAAEIKEKATNAEPAKPVKEEDETQGGVDFDTLMAELSGETKVEESPEVTDKNNQEIVSSSAEAADKFSETREELPTVNDETAESSNEILMDTGFALSWFSAGQKGAVAEEVSETNLFLSEFIENPNFNFKDYKVVYSIPESTDFKKNYKSLEAFKEGKKLTIQELSYLPVKATLVLKSNNKAVTAPNGDTLEFFIHDSDFRFAENKADEAISQLLDIKGKVVEASRNGVSLESEITEKRGGHLLKNKKGEEPNNLGEVLSNPEELTWLTADKNGILIDSNADTDPDFIQTVGNTGSIYIKSVTGNGTPFPLRTVVSSLTESDAQLVYLLYSSAINSKTNFNRPVSSFGPIMTFIETAYGDTLPLDLTKTTVSELLDFFIYQGEKFTKGKGKGTLYVKGKNLYIADKVFSASDFTANKEIIIELLQARNRQVSRKALANTEYKKYIVQSGVLQAPFGVTEYGTNFIQTSLITGELNTGEKGIVKEETSTKEPGKDVTNTSKGTATIVNKATPNANDQLSLFAEPVGDVVESAIEQLKKDEEIKTVSYKGTDYLVDLSKGVITNLKSGKVLEGGVTSPIGNTVVDLSLKSEEDKEIVKTEESGIDFDPELFGVAEEPNSTDVEVVVNPVQKNVSEKPENLPSISRNIPFNYGNNKQLVLEGKKTITSRNHKFVPDLKVDQSAIQMIDGKPFKITYHGELKHSEVKEKVGIDYSEGEAFSQTTKGEPTEKKTKDFINGIGTKHIYQISALESSADVVEPGFTNKEDLNSNIDDISKDDQEFFGAVFKVAPRKNEFKKDIVAREAEHIKELLPKEISVSVIEDYVKIISAGEVATGMFLNGAITLSEKADRGTAYHEAFHAVFRTMLTQKEIDSLVAESKEIRTFSKKDIEDAMLFYNVNYEMAEQILHEEELADEFGDYMVSPQDYQFKEKEEAKKGFFYRLLEWIKLVTGYKMTTKKLFKDVQSGKYKNATVKISRGVRFKRHPLFSEDVTEGIVNGLTYMLVNRVNAVPNVNTILDRDLLDKFLRFKINEAVSKNDMDLGSKYNNVLLNLDYFVPKIESSLNRLGIKNAINAKLSEAERESVEQENEANDAGIVPLDKFSTSSKASANNTIKLLVSLLPDISKVSYEGGERKVEYNTEDYLGMPKFVDSGFVWMKLKNKFSNIVPYTDAQGNSVDVYDTLLSGLRDLAAEFPAFDTMINTLESSNQDVKSMFTSAMVEHKFTFETLLRTTNDQGRVEYRFTTTEGDNGSKKIVGDWSSNFSNQFIQKNLSGNLIYNADKIKAATEKYNTVFTNARKLGKNAPQSEVNAVFNQILDMFDSVGIIVSDKGLNREFSKLMASDKVNDLATAMVLYLNSDIKFLFTTELPQAIGKELNFLETDTIESVIENEKSILELAGSEAYFNETGSEANFLGPDSKNYYAVAKHNNMTLSLAQWASNPSKLDEMLATPWGKGSVWGDLAKTGNLKATSTINVKDLDNNRDKGNSISGLSDNAYTSFVFHSYLEGRFIGLAEADKSSQFQIVGPEVIPANVKNNTSIGKNGKVRIAFDSDSRGVQILKGYFASELNRILATQEELKILEDKDKVNYFHTKKKGLKMHLFPNANLSKIVSGSNRPLGKQNEDGTWRVTTITPEMLRKDAYLDGHIKFSLENAINKDIKRLVKDGVFVVGPNNLLAPGNLSSPLARRVANEMKKTRGMAATTELMVHNVLVELASTFTLNSIIANVEQTKLFTGDPALFKEKGGDLFADFTKRIPLMNISGTVPRIYKDDKGNWEVRPTYKSATIKDAVKADMLITSDKNIKALAKAAKISEEAARKMLAPYLEVETTDAQAYITMDLYRERLKSYGKWTSEGSNSHEAIYQKIKAGEDVSNEQIGKFLAQPLKVAHAEIRVQNGQQVTHYNKQSEFPLLPNLTKGTDLDNLRIAMESKNGADHVIYETGKKVGATGVTNILDSNGKVLPASEIVLNTTELATERALLQQDLSAKNVKSDMGVGSQLEKNILANIDVNSTYELDGKPILGSKLINTYHETVSEISDLGLNDFFNLITDEEGNFNQDSTYDYVLNSLEGELSEDQIDALNNRMPFNSIPGMGNKLQQKILSLLKSKAVTLTHLGGAGIQASALGLHSSERFTDLSTTNKEGIIWLQEENTLKPPVIEDGKVTYAEILLPYKFVKKLKGYEDMTRQELIDAIDPKLLEGVLYRIPNQGMSSNDAFRIIGFLPETVGDTIITYDSITTKTGADFDIDKLFYMIPELYYSEKENKLKYIEHNSEMQAKMKNEPDYLESIKKDKKKLGIYTKGLKNRRMEIMKSILTDVKTYKDLISPLDSNRLPKMAEELFPAQPNTDDLGFFTAFTQMDNKKTFDTAKALVGPIANQMTTHAVGQYRQLELTNPIVFGNETFKKFSNIQDVTKKENISFTLNEYMNAIVDAAKDPYIARMNVNFFTANTLFAMISLGIEPNTAALFIGSPTLAIFNNMVKENGNDSTVAFNEMVEILKREFPDRFDIEGNFMSDKFFQNNSFKTISEKLKADIKSESLNPETFYLFLELQTIGTAFSDVIKSTKSSVNGAGKSLVSANVYRNTIDKVRSKNTFSNLDEFLGMDEFGDFTGGDNFISTYNKNSVEVALNEIADILNFDIAELNNVSKVLGDSYGTNARLQEAVYKEMNAVKLARPGSPLEVNSDKMKYLFSDKGLLSEIKDIKFNSEHEFYNNLFIKKLSIKQTAPGNPNFIYINNSSKMDPIEIQKVKNDLLEIFDKNERLAKDLALHAFYSSGFNFSMMSLVDFIPMDILGQEYKDYVESDVYNSQISYKDLDYIALNNTDNTLIWKNINFSMVKSGKEGLFTPLSKELDSLNVGYSEEGSEFLRYLNHTKTDDATDITTTSLYMLVNIINKDGVDFPIYRKVKPLGYKRSGFRMYEFNTNESIVANQKNIGVGNENYIKLFMDENSEIREITNTFTGTSQRKNKVSASPEQVQELIKNCK